MLSSNDKVTGPCAVVLQEGAASMRIKNLFCQSCVLKGPECRATQRVSTEWRQSRGWSELHCDEWSTTHYMHLRISKVWSYIVCTIGDQLKIAHLHNYTYATQQLTYRGMIQMNHFHINLVTPHQLVVLQPKQITDKDAALGFNHTHINLQCHLDS